MVVSRNSDTFGRRVVAQVALAAVLSLGPAIGEIAVSSILASSRELIVIARPGIACGAPHNPFRHLADERPVGGYIGGNNTDIELERGDV